MKKWLLRFLDLINLTRNNNLSWQVHNQEKLLELSHRRALAKEGLAAELHIKSLELAHNVERLKTRQAAELAMLKTRCDEDIKDYEQYLKSLEQLKLLTKASFSHLPEAIALTIHHHAKTLLNRMWETENLDEKIRLESQLINFMTTVHEESKLNLSHVNRLPEHTLKLMSQDSVH